jgi:hypothetical protein
MKKINLEQLFENDTQPKKKARILIGINIIQRNGAQLLFEFKRKTYLIIEYYETYKINGRREKLQESTISATDNRLWIFSRFKYKLYLLNKKETFFEKLKA